MPCKRVRTVLQAIGQILKVGQRRSIRHAQSDTENRKLPAASHWKWVGINLDGAPLSNWVPQVLHSSTICRGRNGTFHKRLRTHWHTAQLTWQKMERHTEHTKPNSMALCSRGPRVSLIWQRSTGPLQPAYLVAKTRGSEVHTSHLGHVQELPTLAVNRKAGLQAQPWRC